jgi:hypothetical protein
LKKIFLGFPGPPQTRFTLSFLIFKKKLKFDGGYCTLSVSGSEQNNYGASATTGTLRQQ